MSAELLRSRIISTPLGDMSAVSSKQGLHSLVFSESRLFCTPSDTMMSSNAPYDLSNAILDNIEDELQQYFSGALQSFHTALAPEGSAFSLSVWQALQEIPYSKTASYNHIAQTIGRDKAYRAVGTANGLNPLVIVIPCHRIIQANGQMGGYSAGLERKIWLLNHEKIQSMVRTEDVYA